MKKALVFLLLILGFFAMATSVTALPVDEDLLFGGPGGIFFNGDGYAVGGDVNFNLYAGGNGRYFDVGIGIDDCLTAPALTAFATYSDRYFEDGTVGLVTGLAIYFDPFARVQSDAVMFSRPFKLIDFDLFIRLDLDVGNLLGLASDLNLYGEFGVVPVWAGAAWTTATRWEFGFSYQWTPTAASTEEE